MLLSELAMATGLRYEGEDTDICSIEYDSRRVKKGSLFCCIVGAMFDGHSFAQSALDSGATALLVERKLPLPAPQIVVKNARKAMAEMAAAFYGYPQREMMMLGVTGTNGKTTTTYMVKAIAEQAGKKVGVIGTIRNLIGNESIHTDRTTPESVDLFRILRMMADAHVDLVVMETSSHALEQFRVHGIKFDVGLFTNLTQDHLDYHKSFDNYLAAKKTLFLNSKKAVINVDDPYSGRMMEGLAIPIMTFGVRDRADISATDIDITTDGVRFDLHTPEGEVFLNLAIPGLFSVFNAMGAAGMALAGGMKLSAVKAGLESLTSVSGRLEPVKTNRDFSVFVDYAHTPDALENVLKTVQQFAKGRVICVFGCGGDRDRAKRPIMGEIAGRFSELAVITSDNPRTEDPMAIIETIEEGVKRSGTKYAVIENRKEAIRYALSVAQGDDVIMIAGKGHENYQEIKGTKYHFDDKEIVEELLAEL
ncbi:MAG TPA: UDP-N-acetylmuramoyl-L-alanyl-D-glutamate--2,6-diaminopimelate ligase [Clostridiales bacterium]|jgi:UDP-N-acetylmuramoyl-L-alanyl-D-glutamate--2,6-diaminopimelate ligase|nr:UDP-N-acetylmuramoyl-L-alanyl-D-glutamate--2,6-diaminopimelate ligase [Clostridiales bacterium]